MLNKGLLTQQVYISKGGIIGTKEFVEKIIEDHGKKYHPYYNNKKPRQRKTDEIYT